jgi:hypothetical protein
LAQIKIKIVRFKKRGGENSTVTGIDGLKLKETAETIATMCGISGVEAMDQLVAVLKVFNGAPSTESIKERLDKISKGVKNETG